MLVTTKYTHLHVRSPPRHLVQARPKAGGTRVRRGSRVQTRPSVQPDGKTVLWGGGGGGMQQHPLQIHHNQRRRVALSGTRGVMSGNDTPPPPAWPGLTAPGARTCHPTGSPAKNETPLPREWRRALPSPVPTQCNGIPCATAARPVRRWHSKREGGGIGTRCARAQRSSQSETVPGARGQRSNSLTGSSSLDKACGCRGVNDEGGVVCWLRPSSLTRLGDPSDHSPPPVWYSPATNQWPVRLSLVVCVCGGGGGVFGTRPWCWFVCLGRRLWASRHCSF